MISLSGVPWILDVISFSITFIGREGPDSKITYIGGEDSKIRNIEIVLDLVNLLSVRNLMF